MVAQNDGSAGHDVCQRGARILARSGNACAQTVTFDLAHDISHVFTPALPAVQR
jgi:hypothetical protein